MKFSDSSSLATLSPPSLYNFIPPRDSNLSDHTKRIHKKTLQECLADIRREIPEAENLTNRFDTISILRLWHTHRKEPQTLKTAVVS